VRTDAFLSKSSYLKDNNSHSGFGPLWHGMARCGLVWLGRVGLFIIFGGIKKMRTKQEVLEIKNIKVDKELYPRSHYDWHTGLGYAEAMRTGSKFPPITVAKYKGNFLLVDGKHRLEAMKQCKKKHIQCVILKGLNYKQIYLKSIEANVKHGRPFTFHEKLNISVQLKEFGYNSNAISKIIGFTSEKMQKFSVTRITSTISGNQIALKGSVKHLSGSPVTNDFGSIQEKIMIRDQESLIKDLLHLLQEDLLDWKNPKVEQGLNMISQLLAERVVA